MNEFQERCKDFCTREGLVLNQEEIDTMAEYAIEGLSPSQAPILIKNMRKLRAVRATT